MNSIVIKGRLARDPELRHTQSGTPVASFCVAVDRRFTPQGQEKQADFIDCVAWRQSGEFVDKYFSKGQEILVRGSMQSRKWEDKDGNKRISWEIVADEIEFSGPKQDGYGSGTRAAGRAIDVHNDEPEGAYSGNFSSKAPTFSELDGGDGDLPF